MNIINSIQKGSVAFGEGAEKFRDVSLDSDQMVVRGAGSLGARVLFVLQSIVSLVVAPLSLVASLFTAIGAGAGLCDVKYAKEFLLIGVFHSLSFISNLASAVIPMTYAGEALKKEIVYPVTEPLADSLRPRNQYYGEDTPSSRDDSDEEEQFQNHGVANNYNEGDSDDLNYSDQANGWISASSSSSSSSTSCAVLNPGGL